MTTLKIIRQQIDELIAGLTYYSIIQSDKSNSGLSSEILKAINDKAMAVSKIVAAAIEVEKEKGYD